jgi:very-short-patch-repair endonuclease
VTPEAQLTRKWLKVIRDSGDDEQDRLVIRCGEAVALAERVKATSLDPTWAERLEGLSEAQVEDVRDATRIVLAWRGRWWRLFSPTYHRNKAVVHPLRPGAIGEVFWSSAEALWGHLEARSLRTRLRRMNEGLIPQAPFRQPDEHSQLRFPHLASKALEIAIWLSSAGRSRPWIGELLEASVAGSGRARLAELLAKTRVSLERAPIILKLREALDRLGSFLLPEGLEEPRRLIEGRRSITEWTKEVSEGLDSLQDLIALDLDRPRRDGLARAVLGALEDYERDLRAAHAQQLPEPPNHLPASEYGGWWQALVKFAASRLWQGACESEHPELIGITPDDHSEKVRQLRDLLERKRLMEAEAIRGHWAARQAARRNAPWTQMFALRGGKKNGGAKTLRQAVELSLPHGLLDMRPCWLANPASVSQIFPLRDNLFDLVIFDEASQCPIEQALPAIYRGKALIVSGDEKQLPPTNFFLTQWQKPDGDGSDEDDSDVEATDTPVEASARQLQQLGQEFMLSVEDLLQAAVGLFPHDAQAKLLVHYRSRDPALIEFSNHAFYEGQLEAPPSAHANSCGIPPIQYRSVNGTYRDRMNCDEAREVVRVLKEFWLRNGPSPTIGVVTFNKPQQELIEDRIEKECHHDEAFAVRYQQEQSRQDGNQDVGFFVRNLENVQGDERDVMIFSTTFGRDPGSRFIRNFGPVGQVGGERRLNVAVTRARDQVVILGSMPIDEIATALSPHMGPGAQLAPRDYLQLYLAYAEAVSSDDRERSAAILRRLRSSDQPPPPPGPESPLEQEVRDVLEGWGLAVECQVGDSGFRIDLGVRHRDPVRGYALGIECDGATYHSDRSARARDIWREDILRRQGWEIHRIWSTRWWSNREQEITSLQDEVERALSR